MRFFQYIFAKIYNKKSKDMKMNLKIPIEKSYNNPSRTGGILLKENTISIALSQKK